MTADSGCCGTEPPSGLATGVTQAAPIFLCFRMGRKKRVNWLLFSNNNISPLSSVRLCNALNEPANWQVWADP